MGTQENQESFKLWHLFLAIGVLIVVSAAINLLPKRIMKSDSIALANQAGAYYYQGNTAKALLLLDEALHVDSNCRVAQQKYQALIALNLLKQNQLDDATDIACSIALADCGPVKRKFNPICTKNIEMIEACDRRLLEWSNEK
jgi:tetratricopeptide (TPR) repeat protein